jgi:hypothetical protein
MRRSCLTTTALAAAFLMAGAVAPAPTWAQQPQAPQAEPAPTPPGPYKPVAVQLPKPVADPAFAPFRKQIAALAEKKDRAGLARLVASNFFWLPEDKDVADKSKPGIDNLAKALGLDGRDAAGWEILTGFAGEESAEPNRERNGVLCAPGEATFDEKAAEELANATQTDPAEWGYPGRDGVEVRSGPEPTSAVTGKLGLHLVRVFPDESPASAVHGESLRIVTPDGKLGFVSIDAIFPLVTDQLCYVKDGNAWKIAGLIGGEPPNR